MKLDDLESVIQSPVMSEPSLALDAAEYFGRAGLEMSQTYPNIQPFGTAISEYDNVVLAFAGECSV